MERDEGTREEDTGLSIRYNVVLCRVREEDAGLSIRRGWFSKAADAGQGTTGEGRQARSKQLGT